MAKKKFSVRLTVFISIIAVIIGFLGGLIVPLYAAQDKFTQNITTDELVVHSEVFYSKSGDENAAFTDINADDADLAVHFLELGNKYTGDCTLIQIGDVEILIDCGSRSDSVKTVSDYINNYVKPDENGDRVIEYVIITHAHQDHYAGFATSEKVDSIFDLYTCENIITFAGNNQNPNGTTYKNYLRELDAEIANGAKHFTAADCYNGENDAQRTYDLGAGYQLEILYNKFYFEKATTENDYSVCCMIYGNGNYLLFTGDLEEKGEKSLADKFVVDHPSIDFDAFRVDLYKAGHHGSKTSSTTEMLSVFKPKLCCVCCCAGSPEYTKTKDNQFPTQTFINRISEYTDKVFLTTLCVNYDENLFESFNGDIIVLVKGSDINVKCSANDKPLKETQWFKDNRTCPNKWLT